MAFDFEDVLGFNMSDITSGSDNAPLPDVSYGGPDEQPSNPGGNGTGQWLMGAFDKALNYALQRDAAKMRVDYTTQSVPRQTQPSTMPGSMNTRTLMVMGGVGVLALLLLRKT